MLERLARGDSAALGELAVRYEASLLGLARGLLGGSRGLAEEAVQDVWLGVLRSATDRSSGFRGDAGVKTWLYRVTINRCRDIRKREARRGRREMISLRLVGTKDDAAPPVEAAERIDGDGDALHAAVMALPAVQREAVLLCHHRGLTQADAALVLAIPEGTLKGRVRAGLAKLRRSLAPSRTVEQTDSERDQEAGFGDVG